MIIKSIFVDLDDVLNEFTISALHHLGATAATLDNFPPVGFNMVAAANHYLTSDFTAETLWAHFDYPDVWATRPVGDNAVELLNTCNRIVGLNNVFIVTKPIRSAACYAGKYEWVARHFPAYAGRLILTEHKERLASPDALLIDDSDANVDAWRFAGGPAILVPRPWNSARESTPVWWGAVLGPLGEFAAKRLRAYYQSKGLVPCVE